MQLAVSNLSPLPQLRALRASLAHCTDTSSAPRRLAISTDILAIEMAFASFFRDDPKIAGEDMATFWAAIAGRWGLDLGQEFGRLAADDWDRLRRAALEMKRPVPQARSN